jgi:hypothetical protein
MNRTGASGGLEESGAETSDADRATGAMATTSDSAQGLEAAAGEAMHVHANR